MLDMLPTSLFMLWFDWTEVTDIALGDLGQMDT